MSAGIETDSKDERRTEEPALLHLFLQRKVALEVIVVLLARGVLLAASRGATSAIVPDLLGERVDSQLDVLRLRLETAGLVLDDVTIKPCPALDVPGASLEELPGTIIDQHPAGGEKVAASSAIDVTVCLPERP
jgi:beta-lactam-binding protein with PASTA domain